MNIKTFYFNPYRECTYVADNGQGKCFIVDPGMYGEGEEQRMTDYLTKNGLEPIAILITHTHIDHICGLNFFRQQWHNILVFGSHFDDDAKNSEEDVFVKNGFSSPRIIPTPGHKEDCVCYYFEEEKILFSGDTLFYESVGRTDLEGGDTATLLQSLQRLMELPEDTKVYPGHAYPTTIGHEKEYNPFL